MSDEQKAALERVAAHVVDCESEEWESYVTYCDELGIDPHDIRGKEQSNHVYALALIGLDLEFPEDF